MFRRRINDKTIVNIQDIEIQREYLINLKDIIVQEWKKT